MAEELPPGTPEVDDPLLVADLIKLLSIKGAIGRLPLANIVLPVVSLGDVVTPTINVQAPAFRSTDIFTAGVLGPSPAGTVYADTGSLTAGTHDLQLYIPGGDLLFPQWVVEHRNAANTAVLASWNIGHSSTLPLQIFSQTFSYEFAVNERLRVVNLTTSGVNESGSAVIFARVRT